MWENRTVSIRSKGNGAADEKNLEAQKAFPILEELEDWAAQLRASPEVLLKLREFETAARKPEILQDAPTSQPARRGGPHLPGPS